MNRLPIEAAEDKGKPWRKDFNMTYVKVKGS